MLLQCCNYLFYGHANKAHCCRCLASNSFHLFSRVVFVYCSILFACSFVCPVYFKNHSNRGFEGSNQILFFFNSQVLSVTVLSVCYFLCLSCPAILITIVSASLAQWLEHWSCKPVVESSNLSRGCKGFFFIVPIDTQMIFQFIYTPID